MVSLLLIFGFLLAIFTLLYIYTYKKMTYLEILPCQTCYEIYKPIILYIFL